MVSAVLEQLEELSKGYPERFYYQYDELIDAYRFMVISNDVKLEGYFLPQDCLRVAKDLNSILASN